MTLKHVCQQFTDDLQQELSELMYRAAMASEADTIVADFCTSRRAPAPPPPPRKRRREAVRRPPTR